MKNFPERKRIRHPFYDYSSGGAYFVTICTKDRINFFGDIENGVMCLNPVGHMVLEGWTELQNKFHDIQLDQFIIMPNHLHGIIVIDGARRATIHRGRGEMTDSDMMDLDQINPDMMNPDMMDPDMMNHVPTMRGIKNNPMTFESNSLGKIIRYFKGKSCFMIRKQFPDVAFGWQSRFYDHIIRNESRFLEVQKYILENPRRWAEDGDNLNNP